jgi:serine O-acetyltransferase
VVKDVPGGVTVVGIPARVVGGAEVPADRFAAYGVSGDMNDPVVQALHRLIDHSSHADRRIDALVAAMKQAGIAVEESPAEPNAFDPNYLNRIVD